MYRFILSDTIPNSLPPPSPCALSALLIHQPKQYSAPAVLLSVLSSFLVHLAEK